MTNDSSTGKQSDAGTTSIAPVLLTCTMLFWGGNAVAGKFAVGEVSPMVLTAIRWAVATTILLVFAVPHLRRDWGIIRSRLVYLFMLGAVGFGVFNVTLYSALQFTTAINATIIQSAMPMAVFALNFLVFRTHLHWAQALGYTVTLAGVVVTASRGDLGNLAALGFNFGDLLMLVATFIYASYSVALRNKPTMHWLSFMTVLAASATLASTAIAAIEVGTGAAIWPTSQTAWAVILYTAILPSAIGQAFFVRGVELMGSNRASIFLNLVPIFGAILAIGLLGEAFETYHALALVLVIGGLTIAQHLTPGNH